MKTTTTEQQAIIEAVQEGKDVLVQALAGTGKSSTLRLLAEATPNKNFLVLCFNAANAEESNSHPDKPSNIIYSTVHALAYATTMQEAGFRKKLNAYLDFTNLDEELIVGVIGKLPVDTKKYREIVIKVKRAILDVVTYYCRTDKHSIIAYAESLLSSWFTPSDSEYYRHLELSLAQIVQLSNYCKEYWLQLIDSKRTDVKITHDVYLKLFELRNSTIREVTCKKTKTSISIDVIMLDECLTNKHYVHTNLGNIRINSLHTRIQAGELILAKSFNTATKVFEYKRITGSLVSHNREVLTVISEGLNKLHCTPNHPILTQRGYVEASELEVGKDILYLDNVNKQKTKYLLNPDQLQVVLGSYLGDGCLVKQSAFNTFRLSITQGEKQKEYLIWKASCLGIEKLRLLASGYTGKNTVYQSANTKVFLLENTIANMLYKLDALGLAIWYMDDGSLTKRKTITISSNSFSYEEHELLLDVLAANFNLYPTIGKEKTYYNLRFNVNETRKLLDIVSPYIHPDLQYKLPDITITAIRKLNPCYLEYGANYIKEIVYEGIETVYDITVEGNHNFVTSCSYAGTGIIVHNCQDSNGVTLSIFNKQKHIQQVGVGDENQQLYSWRGAGECMSKFPTFTKLPLTISWRFNQHIADMANEVLLLNDSNLQLIGGGTKEVIDTRAHLARTNASVLIASMSYIGQGKQVFANVDLNDIFSKLWHLQSCYFNEKPKYPNKELANIVDKQTMLEALQYDDQLVLVSKLGKYLNETYGSLTKAKAALQGKLCKEAKEADIVVSTIHRSKGLGFSSVVIDEDLVPFDKENECYDVKSWLASFDNRCLLYVAITRAEVEVTLPYYINL